MSSSSPAKTNWKTHTKNITECERCPRLRNHCLAVAKEKRKSFKNDTYWGKPVPGFGDINAEVVLIGLAPAAHGANRTGRMFTGDRSGDWLYRALYKVAFASQPHATDINDGLKLTNAFITATAHCAPPDNKPTPKEMENCLPNLDWEFRALTRAKVYIALGKIAFDQSFKLFRQYGWASGKKPTFKHGTEYKLDNGRTVLCSFHPSQQNTFTGRLTEPMFDSIFNRAGMLICPLGVEPVKAKSVSTKNC